MLLDETVQQANMLREWATPEPAPEPVGFSAWSAAKAGVKGPVGAGLEMGATGLDLLAGAARETARRPRPMALKDQPDDAARRAADAQGVSGRTMRQKADEFAPSPETAHWADQAIYGLSKGITKYLGYSAALGPFGGAGALGLDEGNNSFQRLSEKGIPLDVAGRVGAVTGAAAGLGAMLPIGGATAAKTAALVGIGGPGLFMAQEQLAKNILLKANLPDEANLHDPFDPVGLAVSLGIPAIAGGIHLKGLAKAQSKAKAGSDAALRGEGVLSPAEQKASDQFERSAGNVRELQAAVLAQKDPAAKTLLQTELDKQLGLATKHAGEAVAARGGADPEMVAAARVRVTEDRLTQTLPDQPNARAEMMRAADDIGAGRMPEVEPMIGREERDANLKAWFADSKVVDDAGAPLVVYHGTATSFDSFSSAKMGSSMDAGKLGQGFYFSEDPSWSSSYANSAARKGGAASVMPVHLSLKSPLVLDGSGTYIEQMRRATAGWGLKNDHLMTDDMNPAWPAEFTGAAMVRGFDGVVLPSAHGQTEFVAFKRTQVKSAIGNSGKFDPNSASLTDPLQPGERNPSGPESAARQDIEARDTAPSPDAAPTESMAPALPAKPARPEVLIALRKRVSVLESLKDCL